MPRYHDAASSVVRGGLPRKLSPVAYGIVFLLSGAAAYWWQSTANRAAPVHSYASTAFVHVRQQEPPAGKPMARDENVKPAIRPGLDVVRQKISVQTENHGESVRIEAVPSAAGDCKIAVTATETVPDKAAETANSMAQSYAEAYRAEWRSLNEWAYRESHEAAGRAEKELQEARARLERCYEQQLQARQESARKRESVRIAQPPPPPPPVVENPEWVELNRQLDMLRQRRSALLVERMPIHPEIQDVEARIQQAEQQIAATPRTMGQGPAPAPPSAPVDEKPVVDEQAADSLADAAQLQRLKDAVAEAGRASDEAARGEWTAWQVRLQEPAIDLELAQPEAPARTLGFGMTQLFAALAAGLSTVAGVGMITAGAGIDPALATVAEVQTLANAPVVGVIQESSPHNGAAGVSRRQRLLRRTLIAAGLLLMVGCLAMLLMVRAT